MKHIPQHGEDGSQKVDRVSVQVRLPKALDRRLEEIAFKYDMSKRQLVEEAVKIYLENEKAA